MISSEEFQQKLRAGQIHQALAIVMRDAIELDVTTQMTEDSMTSRQPSREYLRTKINLLTGDIQNEVSKDLIIDSSSYLKLQQLHIDQIVASHRIMKSHLDQIKSILTVLSPTQPSSDAPGSQLHQQPIDSGGLKSDSLLARLTQLTAMPRQNPQLQQFGLVNVADSTFTDCHAAELATSNDLSEQQQSPPAIKNTIELMAVAASHQAPIDPVAIDDDDIDLSIDRDGDVWEEWVEDEDLISELVIPQLASVLPTSTMPDWAEKSVRQQLNSIDVKPIIPRSTAKSVDPSTQWDKFAPEYIGIYADAQPRLNNNRDSRQMDRLLADLDI